MIQMLSAFDLRKDESLNDFKSAYAMFMGQMQDKDLIVRSGPICSRVPNTPMDTDGERSQQYFSVTQFRDRKQLDASYAFIAAKTASPDKHAHWDMYQRIENSVFLCWEDPS